VDDEGEGRCYSYRSHDRGGHRGDPGCHCHARRSDAFTALETVRAAQEMNRAETGAYRNTADFNAGLLPGCSQGMAGSNYTISVVAAAGPPPTFTVTATPTLTGRQAGDFTLTVNQDGDKTYNGTPLTSKSWEDLPRHP
jgi:Tfp pilus assembly protein PilE